MCKVALVAQAGGGSLARGLIGPADSSGSCGSVESGGSDGSHMVVQEGQFG